MVKTRKILSIILALTMVCSFLQFTAYSASPENYGDFPNGSWSEEAITAAIDNGLMVGTGGPGGKSFLYPKNQLTRAQMAAIINRAFGATAESNIENVYSDVTLNDWYYHDVARAVNMLTLHGTSQSTMNPNSYVKREDVFTAIARALVLDSDDTSVLTRFFDESDISGYARSSVAALIEAGYADGYPDGRLLPKKYVTREEFAQLLHNIIKKYISQDGSQSIFTFNGNVLIRAPGVYLHDTEIFGDLIVGDGVGAGNITLENVVIHGRILFRGGEGTVQFNNKVNKDKLIVNDVNGTVHFNHYKTETYFRKNAVYNTPASFLGGVVIPAGGSTDYKEDVVTPGGGGSVITTYIKYKINHWKQDTNLTTYTLADTEEPSARLNSTVNVTSKIKSYDGFLYDGTNSQLSGTATPSLVLNIYYNRRPYTITYKVDGAVYATETGYYGCPYPTVADPAKSGYTFDGWYDGAVKINSASTVTGDKTLEAKFTLIPPTDAQYSVKYYKQNITRTGYDEVIADSYNTTGTINSTVTANAKSYEGFTKNAAISTESGIVAGNGSLVLHVYFDRNLYTVRFLNYNGDVLKTESVAYEADATPPADPVRPEDNEYTYTFSGWSAAYTNITVDTDITAQFTSAEKFYSVTFISNGTQYAKVENIRYNGYASPFPAEPSDTGYEFLGWFKADDTEFRADTNVTESITVYARWNRLVKVEFYELGTKLATVFVQSGTKVAGGSFPTPDYPTLEGYKKDSSISSLYSTPYTHVINGAWYTEDSGVYEKFTSDTVVTVDTEVSYMFRNAYAHGYFFKLSQGFTVKAPFDSDSKATDTLKDAIYLNKNSILSALDASGYANKPFEIGRMSRFADTDRNILIQNINLRFSKLIGEDKLDTFMRDNIKTSLRNNRDVMRETIDDMLSAGSADLLRLLDNIFVTELRDPSSAVTVFTRSKITVPAKPSGMPYDSMTDEEYKNAYLDQAINTLINDAGERSNLIDSIINDDAKRGEMLDMLFDNFVSYSDFLDIAVDKAMESGYDAIVTSYINALKNDEYFEFDDSSKLILLAVKKYFEDEISIDTVYSVIPKQIIRFIPNRVVTREFNRAVGDYRTQLSDAYAVVNAGGAMKVDCYIKTIINPVEDVFIPYCEKSYNKILAAINANPHYSSNAYLLELVEMLSPDVLLDNGGRTGAGYTGYKVRTNEEYYDMLYKFVVLADDARIEFVNNLPESEIDSEIANIVDKITTYAEKLNNFAMSASGGKSSGWLSKITRGIFDGNLTSQDIERIENGITKLIDKRYDNGKTYFDTKNNTEYMVDAGNEIAYQRIKKAIDQKFGIDIETDVIKVIVAPDGKSVSVNGKVFDMATFNKSVQVKGFSITVNGTVINVAGKTVDVARIIKRLISFAETNEADIKFTHTGSDYKVTINGDSYAYAEFYNKYE